MYCRYCGKETEDGSRYCNACVRFLGDGGAKSRSVPKLGKALKKGEQIFIYDVFAASSGQAVRLFEENKFGRHCSLKLYVTGVLEGISYSLAEGVANSDAGILFYHDQGEQEEINEERFNEIWDSYAGQEEL